MTEFHRRLLVLIKIIFEVALSTYSAVTNFLELKKRWGGRSQNGRRTWN